jgi:hypothetical protein
MSKKQIIKDAALFLLSDLIVMRKTELISSLESHMTATERGKHFFEVRESIKELIGEGLVRSQLISANSRSCEILMIGLVPGADNDN